MQLKPLEGDQLLVERHAEHRALSILCLVSFADCLKEHDCEPAIQITGSKGKALTIRASDICDKRKWRKFVEQQQGGGVYHLATMVDTVVAQYKVWMLKEYGERYRSLACEAHTAWFERVVSLAVVRHIMRHKYELYAQGLESFADTWIAVRTGALLLYQDALKEAARLIHHVMKDPAQAQQLIDRLAETLKSSVREMLQGNRQPLPPLPSGVRLPLALLPGVPEVDDERSSSEPV